jgi:hypothetical protein
MSARNEIDKAISNLFKWADRPEWSALHAEVVEAHIGAVCDKFGLGADALAEELADYNHMLYGVMFEDFASRRWPDGRNLVDDYLQRRAWREGTAGRRYLQQLRDSVLSLYEVVDVARGWHCELRDLVRGGEPVRVHEKAGTQNLAKWDRIAARVLPGDGKRMFSGGVLPFAQDTAQALLKMLETVRKKSMKELTAAVGAAETVERELLEVSCPAFTQLWVADTLQRLRAPLPNIVNRDGERFQFTETRFKFDQTQRAAIEQRLDAADWERGADEPVWNWLASADATDDTPRSLLGSLEMRADYLVLRSNSTERAERGAAILAGMLDGLVGPPLTAIQTPAQMLAERGGETSAAPVDAGLEAVLRQYLDDHYRRTLDEPVPMLDGKTPRACAESKRGRERVIEWLKFLENQEQHRASAQNQRPYDFGWMWDELKLR